METMRVGKLREEEVMVDGLILKYFDAESGIVDDPLIHAFRLHRRIENEKRKSHYARHRNSGQR